MLLQRLFPTFILPCFPCSVPWFCNLFPTLVLARVVKLGMLESQRPPQDYQSRLSPSACCLKSQFLTFFECFFPSLTPGRSSQDFNPQCCSTPRYLPKLILPTCSLFWFFGCSLKPFSETTQRYQPKLLLPTWSLQSFFNSPRRRSMLGFY